MAMALEDTGMIKGLVFRLMENQWQRKMDNEMVVQGVMDYGAHRTSLVVYEP